MIDQQQDTGSIRDFLTVLFKHRTKILAIFFATVATVTIGSFLMSPVYEAKSSILVNVGREYIYRPEAADRGPMVSLNQEEAVNSEINILTSRDLVESVITALQVKNLYPGLSANSSLLGALGISTKITPLQAAVIKFEKDLSVEVVKKTSVIEVTYHHTDPQMAAKAVNLLVELYKGKHFQVHTGGQSSFLEQQLTDHETKLQQSETELEQFKQKNRVYSLDEQRSLLLKQRMELDTDLKNTSNRIAELKQKFSSLQSQMKTIAGDKSRYTQTDRDKIIIEAKAKLLDLQLKEQALLQKYVESNRLVVNVRKEIELVKDFLKQQEVAITGKVNTGNAVYQEAERSALQTKADLESQVAKDSALRRQLAQVDEAIQSLDLNEKKNKELKRDVETNDKNYRTYLDKLEEARISDDMNMQRMSNVSVIQAATIPAKPVKPKKALNILLGIILGAVSGLGYAFFSEYVSQGFSTPESVEKRLGLPVLTTISYKE
jgi:uncharacterized protein involved in exopolysaccharide biosynthesis